MFNSVFKKTIYEKRWFILFWAIGTIAMALLMMSFYHSFKEGGYDQLLKSLPKSLKGLVGDAASLKTVAGYISQEVFALRIPMLTLIMGIILFSGLLAGDEGDGTLQTVLAQPVTRLKVFFEKYLAGLVISFAICFGTVIGVLMGVAFIHEHMSFWYLFQATVGVWLLTVLFGSLAYCLGAITGKKGLAGSVAGLTAFATYLLTSFLPSVTSLASVERISPFHYYNKPSITEHGLTAYNSLIMIAAIVILITVSAFIFDRRDIYQK